MSNNLFSDKKGVERCGGERDVYTASKVMHGRCNGDLVVNEQGIKRRSRRREERREGERERTHDENGVLAGAQSAYHVHSGKQPFSWKGSPVWLAKVQRACNAPPAVSTGLSIQMIRFASLSSG